MNKVFHIDLRFFSSRALRSGYQLFASFILVLFLFHTTHAQLKQVPIPKKSINKAGLKNKNTTARTKATTLKLPFWDDFSFTSVNDPTDSLSNFPLDSIWMDSSNVHVNEGIGINPPSLNVATFDGVNFLGLPYSDQLLANGFGDILTSQPIDLTTVDEAERSTVFLSFFFQWQGNGEAPDPKDFIRVEFLNDLTEWVNVMTISPRASYNAATFYDTIVQVDGNQFFHDQFQFRFRNFGRQSGPYDTWNIDYIYLNKNRNAFDLYFPDGAIASPLSPIFGRYNSVPIEHFRETKEITSAQVDVFNLRSFTASYRYRAFASFTNYIKDEEPLVYDDTLVTSRGIATNPDGTPRGVLTSRERARITLFKNPDPENPLQFNPAAEAIDISLKFKFVTNDVYDTVGNRAVDYYPVYDSIDFRSNDSISATYHLKNYYAYDDGTAESAAILTQAGDRAAYQFDMITTEPDTIVGIYVHFPHYGLTSSQIVDFYIYDDNNGLPGDLLYTLPSRSVQRNDTATFTFYSIIEPVGVQNKFYIGWRAPVEGLLRVGLDLNNNTGDKIFTNSRGTWEPNVDINGSLMIRPQFGKGGSVTGLPEAPEALHAYPNPNEGIFYLPGRLDGLEIHSITGSSIAFHKESIEPNLHKITLYNGVAGLYILKVRRGSSVTLQKIVIR